jgi:hypothetical protein
VYITFKVQQIYLHFLLPGQWWVKYSFLWEKVHNDRRELPICVNASVLFASGGFPYRKTQNTIKYTVADIQTNSVLWQLQPCLHTPSTAITLFKILISFDISATLVILGIFYRHWSIFVSMVIFAPFCHLGNYLSVWATIKHYRQFLYFCHLWSFWALLDTLGTIHHYWTLLVILDIYRISVLVLLG